MQVYKIAIIGVGPKGLYAFERLLAHLNSSNLEVGLEIHLFEKSGMFGCGQVYDPRQPDYLLMNYPNDKINVWNTEMPTSPISEKISFSKWLANLKNVPVKRIKNKYAPRAYVGKYLSECFEMLYKFGNNRYPILKYCSEVTDINKQKDYQTLFYEREDGMIASIDVDHIILTTGHCSWKGNLKNSTNPKNIPFVYPVMEKLKPITQDTSVGIKGLGLTFIDTALALTEGRGGRFEKSEQGTWLYLPSGQEPQKILAFSRSGLPMIPRLARETEGSYEPIFFTHKNINDELGIGEKPSFVKHILPVFQLETKYRYYKVLLEQYDQILQPEANREGLERQIAIFHNKYPNAAEFNFINLFKPRSFTNPEVDLGPMAYMRYVTYEAELGSTKSPFMAAAMTWGALAPLFNSIYSYGGMTPDSHRLFDHKYRSKLNRISYGPPLQNMLKIIALLETGILNFDYAKNPQIRFVDSGYKITIGNSKTNHVDYLIDARIPANRSSKDWSDLLSKLEKRGLIREFLVAGRPSYKTACPEINRLGNVIDKKGRANSNITLYGTLTEGVTYDNDSLSRSRNNMASAWALRTVESYANLTLKQ